MNDAERKAEELKKRIDEMDNKKEVGIIWVKKR